MPPIASITIADSAAANHVFTPQTTDGSKARWENRSSGVPAFYETLEIEAERSARPGQAYKFTVSLTRPITGVVNGQTVVIRKSKTNLVFNFAQDGSLTERYDDETLLKNLLSNATFIDAVKNIEPYY